MSPGLGGSCGTYTNSALDDILSSMMDFQGHACCHNTMRLSMTIQGLLQLAATLPVLA